MAELTFVPVFTDAGRAKVAQAYGLGTTAAISEIAIGVGQWASRDGAEPYAPTEAALEATALQDERVRVPVFLGGNTAPNQVVLSVNIPGDADPADQFFFGEVGIFLDDGTLLAVAAIDTDGGFGWRGGASWVLRFILSWSQLPDDSISVIYSGEAGWNATFLAQQQLLEHVRQAVIASGQVWDPNDAAQLSQAIATLGKPLDAVRKTSVLSPAAGATDLGETPTIAGGTFYSLYGLSHLQSKFQIATDVDFTDPIWTYIDTVAPLTSATVPAATLSVDTTYFVRIAYFDSEGAVGPWSDPVSFSTGATFTSVAQPVNTAPTNEATGVSLTPTLSAGAFAVDGAGVDTHVATQWLLEERYGPLPYEFAAVWDSGEVAAATSVNPPAVFDGLTDYRWSVRYKGDTFGWSPWSATTTFTTAAPAGEVTVMTPGSGTWQVPAGVTAVEETVIGGGGGGGLWYDGRGAGGTGGSGARRVRAVVPGQVIAFVVGDGGAPSEGGESTSIDGEMTAPGGPPGIDGGGGQPGTMGVGGDVNGVGGTGDPDYRVDGWMDAVNIGGGGMASAGYPGGLGAGGGGNGNEAPGGGGTGANNGGGGMTAGKAGMVKFRWGPDVVAS